MRKVETRRRGRSLAERGQGSRRSPVMTELQLPHILCRDSLELYGARRLLGLRDYLTNTFSSSEVTCFQMFSKFSGEVPAITYLYIPHTG